LGGSYCNYFSKVNVNRAGKKKKSDLCIAVNAAYMAFTLDLYIWINETSLEYLYWLWDIVFEHIIFYSTFVIVENHIMR